MKKGLFAAVLAATLGVAGCASYRWTSGVPENLRTISVSTFENRSSYDEIDALATQYVLREFQREGTFKIAEKDEGALKLIGTILSANTSTLAPDRNYDYRTSDYQLTLVGELTLVDTATGKVLMDRRKVSATTSLLARNDMLTSLEDSFPRVAREFGRKAVDAVLAADWSLLDAPAAEEAAPAVETPVAPAE